jgi:MFS transporter, putative metabolite transport protein
MDHHGQAVSAQLADATTTRERVLLDDVPLNGFHCKIAGLTFGAHLTEGYALGTVGYALSSLRQQMDLDAFWMGMIGSSALIGIFAGSLVFGWLSDRVGRQKIFLLSFVIITFAAFAQYYASTPLALCALRVLLGFGMGGDFAVGHAILAEFSPRKHRGMLLGSFSVIWTIGYVAANIIGMELFESSSNAWRWLLGKGRLVEAHAVVRKCFGPNVRLDTSKVSGGPPQGGFAQLFRRDMLRRTIFNCAFFVCLVIPYFAIYTFLPGILTLIHLTDGDGADLLLNGLLIVGAVLGIWLTMVLPRRLFLTCSFAVTCGSLVALSVLPPSATIALIAAFGLFTLVMSAVSNLVGVYPPECFPTEIRASGVGLAIAVSRLGSAVGTFLLPMGVARFGFQPAMMALATVLLIGMVVSIAWAPETRHLRLNDAAKA